MMPLLYLAALLGSAFCMGLLDHRFRVVLWRAPRRAALVLVIGVAFFLLWDLAAIAAGHYGMGQSPLMTGIMLAPESVNLDAQNEGIEHFIRTAVSAGVEVDLTTTARGQRLLVPLREGGTLAVDVLTRVEYAVTCRLADGPPVEFAVELAITPPPRGSARTVATTTQAEGARPAWRHLMSRNFSAPRSAPNPASVTT